GLHDLLHVSEQSVILLQNRESLLKIGKPKISGFELRSYCATYRFNLDLPCVGFAVCDLRTKPTLPRKWNFLRNAKPNISEFAIAKSRKGSRAADAELLYVQLCVRKRRHLSRDMSRCFVGTLRRCDFRVVLFGFANKLLQALLCECDGHQHKEHSERQDADNA